MAVLHTLKVYLYDNVLTETPNDLMARVHSERSLNIKDISNSASIRGGSNISATNMEHTVNLWFKEMAYQLCDGFSVNTGWFVASPHVKGVFDNPDESFNPEKHTVMFEIRQGSLLRKELDTIMVEVRGLADTSLIIHQVVDMKTGSINDLLTPNRNLKISGHKIKITGDESGVGVYFINQDSEERIKVADEDIITNNLSELIIVIPDLAVGIYKLEVMTQYSVGGNLLKKPKSTLFDTLLTVQ